MAGGISIIILFTLKVVTFQYTTCMFFVVCKARTALLQKFENSHTKRKDSMSLVINIPSRQTWHQFS